LGSAVHERDDGGDFFAGYDHGDVALSIGAHGGDAPLHGVLEDAFVEKHQGIRALSMNQIVVETEHVADFIEEFCLLTSRDVRHMGFRNSALKRADNGNGAKLRENPANIGLSGQNGKLING
jgi:hypothetical protein